MIQLQQLWNTKIEVNRAKEDFVVMHKILESEYADEERWELKTTHDKVTYDSLTEQFIVDLGDGCYCEVWGKNRFKRALEIAEKCVL